MGPAMAPQCCEELTPITLRVKHYISRKGGYPVLLNHTNFDLSTLQLLYAVLQNTVGHRAAIKLSRLAELCDLITGTGSLPQLRRLSRCDSPFGNDRYVHATASRFNFLSERNFRHSIS